MKLSRVVEMTITRAEFLRSLPAAVGHEPYIVAGDLICGAGWQILLTPLPDLVSGMLHLQRQRVAFEFDGLDEAGIAAFFSRFEVHFRRGGG